MVDNKKIAKAIKYIIIANIFLLTNFSINIGIFIINLIPNLIGYILLIAALKIFQEYDKTAKLVMPFAYTIFFVSIINISIDSATLTNITWLYAINIIYLIFIPINIYLTYQIYTITANLCEPLNDDNTKKIKKYRNFKIITTVISQILLSCLVFLDFLPIANTVTVAATVFVIGTELALLIYFFVAFIPAYRLFNTHENDTITAQNIIQAQQ